jgi:hypothetical protein
MKKQFRQFAFITFALIMSTNGIAQKKTIHGKVHEADNTPLQDVTKMSNDKPNTVYVDKSGVLRYTSDKAEASFFGVNYISPFATTYRDLKTLNIDLEKDIQQDVYHFARLGLDAFRVHVWDTEISDTLGNLLENDHLHLFDFLLAELKKRNIKSIITPIAFWGNGDPHAPGFSRKYGKKGAIVNDTAIVAQENYMRQFFKHVNPYTGLTYGSDPDVIAVELNNEPGNSGPESGVTNYINRLAAAVRSTGWTKPIYYNISLSFNYAAAVANANIDGVSFHWYPTVSLSNHEAKGNLLPNVDHYNIPYDTIPGYRNKARMVYEFDAAGVLKSYMYPVMARSFREAGFQWATQFAYDPTGLAHANTEHLEHYLNLVYTPSKAISFLIASRVFHNVLRLKKFGKYPADSSFDEFRVSYKESLSEMNSGQEFYYSNSTSSKPVDINKLEHVAGVGSSPVVHYDGLGAYFIDKVGEGIWRLEVMPDVIYIRDPFEIPSLQKEVTRIEWQKEAMSILIPDIGEGFSIKGLNSGNKYLTTARGINFTIEPGTYLIIKKKASGKKISTEKMGVLGMNEFYAPIPFSKEPFVAHIPFTEVSSGKPFNIQAQIVGIDPGDIVSVLINKVGERFDQYRNISMTRISAYNYSAEIPADLIVTGALNYRIVVKKAPDDYLVFPGNHKGNPFDEDFYDNDTWQTFIAAENGELEIFNPTNDRDIRTYPSPGKNFQKSYITGNDPGTLILKLAANELAGKHTIGFEYFFADKLRGRDSETFNKLVIRARTAEPGRGKAKITLINKDASSFAAFITLTSNFGDIEVPFNILGRDSMLVLPVSTPEFIPLWFNGSEVPTTFKLSDAEKIQITIGTDIPASEFKKPYSLEVESIKLQKSK